jgi:GxxExxY protein
MNDGERNNLPHSELTGSILSCSFEVMKELGPGFQERIYKNALLITLKQKGLRVETEQPFEVAYRGIVVGRYSADLVEREDGHC